MLQWTNCVTNSVFFSCGFAFTLSHLNLLLIQLSFLFFCNTQMKKACCSTICQKCFPLNHQAQFENAVNTSAAANLQVTFHVCHLLKSSKFNLSSHCALCSPDNNGSYQSGVSPAAVLVHLKTYCVCLLSDDLRPHWHPIRRSLSVAAFHLWWVNGHNDRCCKGF